MLGHLGTGRHGRHRPPDRATPAPLETAGARTHRSRSWSPVPRWVLARVAVGVTTAVVLGAALTVSMSDPDPLDDPDLAMQRAGILDVVGPRSPAVAVAATVPARGRVAVVFFLRPAQAEPLISALDSPSGQQLRDLVDIGIVVSSGASDVTPSDPATTVAADPDGRLAAAYRMRRPRDGGPPVGYAVVDVDGTIRYRTEDPGLANGLDEVLTIVDAVR